MTRTLVQSFLTQTCLLRKALDIGLHGVKAEQALFEFYEQMRQWDVAVPHVEPLYWILD